MVGSVNHHIILGRVLLIGYVSCAYEPTHRTPCSIAQHGTGDITSECCALQRIAALTFLSSKQVCEPCRGPLRLPVLIYFYFCVSELHSGIWVQSFSPVGNPLQRAILGRHPAQQERRTGSHTPQAALQLWRRLVRLWKWNRKAQSTWWWSPLQPVPICQAPCGASALTWTCTIALAMCCRCAPPPPSSHPPKPPHPLSSGCVGNVLE